MAKTLEQALELTEEDCTVVTIPVDKVREIDSGYEDLDTAIDEAQADVFMGETPHAYVLIKIVK